MEMPHPEEFKTKTHPELVKTQMAKCDMCHNATKTNFLFCNDCHHGSASNWTYDPKIPWQTQHAQTVVKNGIDGCLEKCHDKKFCLDCHTKLQPLPTSHQAPTWLRKPAKELGGHADAFKGQPTSCEICHGGDAPNKNKFCTGCHVLEVPHPAEFKKFHSKTGKQQPQVCSNCHTFKELCSDCHHAGAVDGRPWNQVHGGIVNNGGAGSCFEKCHKQDFCVACHTTQKVVPASHKAPAWTRRATISSKAGHPAAYEAAADACGYCHGTGTPKDNKFCLGCHKLEMPHPEGYGAKGKGNGGQHAEAFKAKTLNKTVCETCHATAFCDSCHHDYTAAKRWVNAHPDTVKKSGATACFDCHEETSCSYCHVRLASQYMNN
ncbi:MAG: hypothetical protein CVT60_00730 [Actinobacteria bacterium HGW-Actinobacteria-10]|jgi:nitrate/TMAO reductase-like tetraheme cytochrome c subunit|nr:MAG: hypothetical protein CVT60_00730 [Actinobacteria bacterium HGW-Actinobacteria-10]